MNNKLLKITNDINTLFDENDNSNFLFIYTTSDNQINKKLNKYNNINNKI